MSTTFTLEQLTEKPAKKATAKAKAVKNVTAKAKVGPQKARKPTTGELLRKLSEFEWDFKAMRA